jgi:hypothetical protein
VASLSDKGGNWGANTLVLNAIYCSAFFDAKIVNLRIADLNQRISEKLRASRSPNCTQEMSAKCQ